jgi:AcrR family transcriptional regulator
MEAIVAMLSEGITFDALSIESVAARAGVGKATIYRRWGSKQEMLSEVLRELKGPPPRPSGGNVRERLLSLLSKVAVKDERGAQIFPCLLPEIKRNEAAYDLWQSLIEPRRVVMREVLRRGIDDGELRSDLDIEVAVAVLTGPIVLNRMTRWNPGLDNDTLPERIVDLVLAGLRP